MKCLSCIEGQWTIYMKDMRQIVNGTKHTQYAITFINSYKNLPAKWSYGT